MLRVLDMKYNIFFYFNSSFRTFFFKDPDPDFSGSDPDFWPIRIQTQKKKLDPDPGKKPESETLVKTMRVRSNNCEVRTLLNGSFR